MLVLTRNAGESIIFGNKLIEIKILAIIGRNVRIGIEAPHDLSVHRSEIFDRIENDQAHQGVLKRPSPKPRVKRVISDIPYLEADD